jgi:hypothetical protein
MKGKKKTSCKVRSYSMTKKKKAPAKKAPAKKKASKKTQVKSYSMACSSCPNPRACARAGGCMKKAMAKKMGRR